jgi:hypothetical protein
VLRPHGAFSRRIATAARAAAFVIASACISSGQEPRFPRPGPPPPPVTLSYALRALNPGVQNELKLTDDQKQKLGDAVKKHRENIARMDEVLKAGDKDFDPTGLTEQEKQNRTRLRGRERNQLIGQLQLEEGAAVEKILTAQQRTRVIQIGLQMDGPRAFYRPDLREWLNLSPDQIEQIQGIVDAGIGPQSRELFQAVIKRPAADVAEKKETLDRQARARVSYEHSQSATLERILGILPRKQRLAYEKLLGEPIDRDKVLASTVLARQVNVDDEAALRGEWEMVSTEHSGKQLASKDKSPKVSIFIDVDSMRTEVDQTGPARGKLRPGIYRIEGDTLTYCYGPPGGPRPTEFRAPEELDVFLVVAKRVEKPSQPKR